MAQTSGWLLVALNKFERMPFFAAIKEAKFRHFVPPGERIDLTARIIHEGSGYAMTQAAITVGGKPRCSAQLTFALSPFPQPRVPQLHGRNGPPHRIPAARHAQS